MNKKGKKLEQLIKCIQESIKDSHNTIIIPNYKIKDNNGASREIDIYIETEIQKEKICIAIECKDYNKKIDIKVIDALIGKFKDLTQINKIVLVSTSGYTQNAKDKATANGIELYIMNDDDISKATESHAILYGTTITDIFIDLKITQQTKLSFSKIIYDQIYYYDDCKEVNLISIFENYLNLNIEATMDLFYECQQNNCLSKTSSFILKSNDSPYVKDENGSRYYIQFIQFEFVINFELKKMEALSINSLFKGLNCVAITSEYKYSEEYMFISVEVNNEDVKVYGKINEEYVEMKPVTDKLITI